MLMFLVLQDSKLAPPAPHVGDLIHLIFDAFHGRGRDGFAEHMSLLLFQWTKRRNHEVSPCG